MDGIGAMHNGRELQPHEAIIAVLSQLRNTCSLLQLSTSTATIDRSVKNLGSYHSIEVLLNTVASEMENKLYLRVPSERERYWQRNDLVSDRVSEAFSPSAIEIRESGTAYACGLWSASVFHSMRAAEGALTAIADELGIARSGTEQWGNLIDLIESRVRQIAGKPKADIEKSAKLSPLSEITADLRLFKDAWRNQNAHNVVAYNDSKAVEILNAVCRVLESAALRVKPRT